MFIRFLKQGYSGQASLSLSLSALARVRMFERLIDLIWFDFFIGRMTVLGRGLVFQPVLVTQTCTHNSKYIALTLQIFQRERERECVCVCVSAPVRANRHEFEIVGFKTLRHIFCCWCALRSWSTVHEYVSMCLVFKHAETSWCCYLASSAVRKVTTHAELL